MIKSARIKGKITTTTNLRGKANLSLVRIYPELENLNVAPDEVEQRFKSENYYGFNEVIVAGVPLQEKTITPTLEDQSITFDENYKGLRSVTVNAIPIKVEENTLIVGIEQIVEGGTLKL